MNHGYNPAEMPFCNADLQVDASREFIFCEYCGTKLFLNKDAKTREAEANEKVRLRELELEQQKMEEEKKTRRNIPSS